VTALSDATSDDLDLNDVFVTAGSDALYLGSRDPFRGVFLAMADSVNVTSSVLSMAYWNGAWTAPSSVVDGTIQTVGRSLSGAGRVVWSQPDDWFRRPLNNSPAYWARLTVTVRPSDETRVGQILPLARSRLTYPTALFTLGLIYAEGWANTRGDWQTKASDYLTRAEAMLDRVLPLVADEFDIDASGATDRLEVNSVTRTLHTGFSWERG
jgi:hypothetical protein